MNQRLLREKLFTFLEILASLKLVNYSKLMYNLPNRCACGSRTNHSNCELGGPRICNHGQESYAMDVNVVSDDKALETTLTSSIKTKNKEDAFNVCLL